MPKLTIDDREIEVAEGTMVIQAAEQLGIFVPALLLSPGPLDRGQLSYLSGGSREEPQAADRVQSAGHRGDGRAHAERAGGGRSAVGSGSSCLPITPLDCPVCDQSGECDLQNFYMNFGLYSPLFREHKVKKQKAVELGPHVMLDQERCILCSRCVRFTDEITETHEFGIFNRGDRAQLAIYPGATLDNDYSANVVDICPVGALTETDFRFKARVWYLSSAPTVCNGCSRGCNIDMHFVLDRPHLNDGARMARVKPRYNADVNEWWLCDEGRYGLGWLDHERLGPGARARR